MNTTQPVLFQAEFSFGTDHAPIDSLGAAKRVAFEANQRIFGAGSITIRVVEEIDVDGGAYLVELDANSAAKLESEGFLDLHCGPKGMGNLYHIWLEMDAQS